ncbi:MAG: hypothetical protein JRD49_12800 [Deltaproteobacteria bacterium]|nr:hypothetical protein [Deltaproteobacteria bacterium]MBW2633351.1 hypothetical protein [Deltaproteobacteria bacterium]MBW2678427.1 hypothetical protein [Deltaproteobacteria bacterium]
MLPFFKSQLKLPGLSEFPLSAYDLKFSIARLLPGVDNVRHDVYLSPSFCIAAEKLIPQVIARHFQTYKIFPIEKPNAWSKRVSDFQRLYQLVMEDAVNKSKQQNELQIDSLAQLAVIKLLIREIRNHLSRMTGQIKNIIRKYEVTDHQDIDDALKTKESLASVLQNKEIILRNVGSELFRYLTEVHLNALKPMREANFGNKALMPDYVLDNPLFHSENPYYDIFLIEEYDVLFGRRLEDPDKYDTLINQFKQILSQMGRNDKTKRQNERTENGEAESVNRGQQAHDLEVSNLIKYTDNIDAFINCYKLQEDFKKRKQQGASKEDRLQYKNQLKNQKILLKAFYRTFKISGMVERIAASYEMRDVYQDYCPPLVPQQILHFMIDPKSRKTVVNRLKRLKKLYRQPFSMKPLKKKIKRLELLTAKDKKVYLIRFINGIARYHRDIENFNIFNEAMERINLTSEEKILNLSRANNTLYEFLLPHERKQDKKPIINHVVIKTDVRGSTDITHQMNKRGLNPASYFSLNFFNPITELLNDYGADKVFIEGDAIILSIYERENAPEGWYSVARACGIAINVLLIISRYNEKSKKNKLPVLELGIGINYNDSSPTFLFDGKHRIMISSAINMADRQSGCSKSIREALKNRSIPFNLYVFQSETEAVLSTTSDDLLLRYNVNGIELNASGFKKLSEEINLRALECDVPELQKKPFTVYTGKFPTTTGRYKRLIIREAHVPRINPETLAVIELTSRKYYEVCTHPKVYQYVMDHTK